MLIPKQFDIHSHSTTQLLLRLVESVMEASCQGKETTTLFCFDVANFTQTASFVWSLAFYETGFFSENARYCLFREMYNCWFQQGSVLGSLLFSVIVSNMVRMPGVLLSLFTNNMATLRLQCQINVYFVGWADNWRVIRNASISTTMVSMWHRRTTLKNASEVPWASPHLVHPCPDHQTTSFTNLFFFIDFIEY